ncbi:hypothetical protein EU528_10860, partial [Candidatus Thorarchaeota archaeon]
MKAVTIVLALFLLIGSSMVMTGNLGQLPNNMKPQTQFSPIEKFELSQTILSSTFLGGDGTESSWVILLDGDDNIIVVGSTSSDDFPMVNALDSTHNGDRDCFITKFSSDATEILYSTYIGGSGRDIPYDCILGTDGSFYVIGRTESTDFPVVNAYNSSHNGDVDCFLFKLSPSGDALVFSTYFGGTDFDVPSCIQLDSSGNVYISGYTDSATFPVINAYDASIGGDNDNFLLKFNSAGNDLIYSTFIGGSGTENLLTSIAIHDNYIYMSGGTSSSDFPITSVCLMPTYRGIEDAYVLRMPLSESSLNYSTYYGGSLEESADFISIDSSGYVVIAGDTLSENLPMLSSYDSSKNSFTDLFVVKINISASSSN